MRATLPSFPRILLRAPAAVVAAVLLLGVAFVPQPTPASAFLLWCWHDPTLVINGKVVHIDLGVPLDQRGQVIRGRLTVSVPSNVSAVLSGAGVPQLPVTVELVRSGTWDGQGGVPVRAEGVVAGPSGMPTALRAWQAGTTWQAMTQSTAGQPMTLAFTVQ